MSPRTTLWGYLVAVAISITGTRVSMIAIPWLVLTTTGSPTKTGLVAFAEMAPLVAAQVLSGPLTDRIGARRMAVGCSAASTVYDPGIAGRRRGCIVFAIASNDSPTRHTRGSAAAGACHPREP